MRCEMCGSVIYSGPHKVIIEGAKLTVCTMCSKHGRPFREKEKPKLKAQNVQSLDVTSLGKKRGTQKIKESLELVENFNEKIRLARKELGVNHEVLGRKLGEKVSLLKKIELGKMVPNNKLATKLERILKIKLLLPTSKHNFTDKASLKHNVRAITLGDLIKLDNKKVEEKE